jgi:sulfhydrogenase subunit beta (sulfur reductase)
MIFEKYYIGRGHWQTILAEWAQKYQVFAPHLRSGGLFFESTDQSSLHDIVVDAARAVQPVKSFFFPALEEATAEPKAYQKPWLFLGVKACDLRALEIMRRALTGSIADPHFSKRLDNSILIGADCTQPYRSCFCTSVEGQPFPKEGFDLNISRIWDGFVVEVGGARGITLLEGFDRALKTVVKEEEEAQMKQRQEAVYKVKKMNRECGTGQSYADLFGNGWTSPVWNNHSASCLECGACNWSCPTCHSYILDDRAKKSFQKMRAWDACLFKGYDVLHGGWTARPKLSDRFRHRLFCKFMFQTAGIGLSGCTGCGRCIDACPVKIDMRLVLHDLEKTGYHKENKKQIISYS